MRRSLLRRITNRVIHLIARHGPGATTIRPLLHRLRGVKIGPNVFIGDEVYIENEYPEAVEIGCGAQISVRAIIFAHSRGLGRIIIEKDVFIGPNTVIATSGKRTLRIGEGAVVGAGVVVTSDVPPRVLLANESPKVVANVRVPLAMVERMEEFIRGLSPISKDGSADGSNRSSSTDRTVRSDRG